MKTDISVIVPVYNVENYLNDCVESIRRQSFSNIEIILIDDGSEDRSGAICDSYELMDRRISVIHKVNEGLSQARNDGLAVAKGKYVLFVDSDDFIDERMVEKLYRTIEEFDVDIAACGYKSFIDGKDADCHKDNNFNEVKIIKGRNLVEQIMTGHYQSIGMVAWNKLYKKELFENYNIQYPKGRVHEDTYTTFKLLYRAVNVSIIEEQLYFYRMRKGSIMNTPINLKRCRDGVDGDIEAIKFFEKAEDNEMLSLALNTFFRDMLITYSRAGEDAEIKEYILDMYKKIWQRYSKKLIVRWYKRSIFCMFQYVPKISILLR